MQKLYILFVLYLFISISWAGSFLFMRIGVPEFGAIVFASLRLIFATLALLPFLTAKKYWEPYKKQWLSLSVIGIIALGVPFMLFSFASKSLNAGIGALTNSSVPILTGIIAHLFFADKLTKRQFFGLILGIFGVYILVSNQLQLQIAPSAFFLAFGACFCYAIAGNLTKRYFQNIPSITITISGLISSSIVCIPFLIVYFPSDIKQISALAWFSAIAIGIISTSMAMIAYYYLIKNYNATKATICTLFVPIFAMMFGYLFLAETIEKTELVGAAIILLSTAIYLLAPSAKKQTTH